MTIPAMRRMLYVAGGFVVVAGAQLFVLTEHTDDFFAWTIDTPLTAAFLGAGYWAAAVLELGSARRAEWSRARVAMPAVLLFTTITLAVTLMHRELFDLESIFGIAWLAVYASFPVAMATILILQLRAAPEDSARSGRLPTWVRVALAGQAVVLLVLGLALLAAPSDTASLWPWPLTPLTARAVGAWLVGVAVIAAHMALEDAPERVEIGMLSYAAFGALQLIAIARYPNTPDWTAAGAALYLGFLAAMVIVGAYGWSRSPSSRAKSKDTIPRPR